MSLIQANLLSFEFGATHILRDVSCTIEHNSRIGLIGANGSGKTTLIRLLLGELQPSDGTVSRAGKLRSAYLPQNAQPNLELRMEEYLRLARPELLDLRAQIEHLSAQMEEQTLPETEDRLHKAIESYTALGGYEWDNELKHVLISLSFPSNMWQKRISTLSGGERTRLCLAFILLQPHDLLILDEPTNHLDIAMISWLEGYLLKQNNPYLIVSHDRSFLDNTVSSIYLLQGARLSITKGNYSSWKEADQIARLSLQRQYERQQKHIAQSMDFVRRNIAGQKTKQAQSRLKQLDRMQLVERPQEPEDFKIQLASGSRSGNDLFVFKELSFSIAGKELARQVSLNAHYQDRICLIGPNGCGKTTFLRMLIGQHQPDDGMLKIGASLKIGYYSQHHVDLDASLSVMDTIWQLVPDAPQGYVLSWLARFGFRGDDVKKSVSILSGGERSRLYLSKLIHSRPNLLIMDEPTNHLDIQMTDALLEALLDFEGSIIFVSHDRWFLSQLATRFWVFRKLLDTDQIYSTVQEIDKTAQEAIELSFAIPEQPKAPPPAPRQKKRRINPRILEMKLGDIELLRNELEKMQATLQDIQMRLSESQTYSDTALLQELHSFQNDLDLQIKEQQNNIDILEHEYLELLCEQE